MSKAALLVELLTEELPPQSLRALSEAFRDRLLGDLAKAGLVAADAQGVRAFATPRRLAVLIPQVEQSGEDRELEVVGPSALAPAQAIAGFARKQGVAVSELGRRGTAKGEVVIARSRIKGAALDEVLGSLVEAALKGLPVPKMMRWGSAETQFVRPVHGLVMMQGARVVPGSALGLNSRGATEGHRFMALGPIALSSADEYEEKLLHEGCVIAEFAARRSEIARQLGAQADRLQARLGEHAALLDEVTALVEYPSVYAGRFDPAFLEVPAECLILTLQKNQKYFPLFGADGSLLARFLIVSNMKLADPRAIVGGNERVVRPRLEDARFFFRQDRKTRLESRVPELAKVVYHRKLGSQLERVERIQLLAGAIARKLEADPVLAERAAWLAKADLLTGMVGEFPELQGVMGRYYALHDGEPDAVAQAIEQHYRPRFAGEPLPDTPVACAVALADKLDALAGLFGAGEQPSGEKDPYGLRRAALGIVRILVERRLALSLSDLLDEAFRGLRGKIGEAKAQPQVQVQTQAFILERFAGYLKELGFSRLQVDSVLSLQPVQLSVVPRQLEAVKAFQSLPEADSLAAANKRVANILRQAQAKGESFARADAGALREPAERDLFQALEAASSRAN
ncbi:MAG TPA: glycine--tRNA ligase subunit beta, partial [Burkholderiales bacterium]|nr:glycine--tRNA ligase subunit beta [Burkholderiales bacterium]